MALIDALYAPIASFEQAQPQAFERAKLVPPTEFDATGDSTANLILTARQGADATDEALDRTSVLEVKRGAWPDMFDEGASVSRKSGTKLRSKRAEGGGFSKPPTSAFEACFRVDADDESSVRATRPGDTERTNLEDVKLEAMQPKTRTAKHPGARAEASPDSEAADLGWIGDIFEDM